MRISQMDLAGPLSGAEYFTLVQDGKTKKVQASSFSQVITSSCQCTLVSRYAAVGTDTNTLEKYLQTWQYPGGTLRTDGSWLEIITWGDMSAGVGNDAVFNFRFGSHLFTYTDTTGGPAVWSFKSMIIRTSATSFRVYENFEYDGLSFACQKNSKTYTQDLLVDIPLSVSGQSDGAGASDVDCHGLIIDLHQIDVNS